MVTEKQLLVASYIVKNMLDPLKDDFAKYLYDQYENISISTPKDAFLSQSEQRNLNIIIGEPPILVVKFKNLDIELKIYSNKLDLTKQNFEIQNFNLKELFKILDKIAKDFNLNILRIGCAYTENKKIEKNIIPKLYGNFSNKQEKDLIGFTHEIIKRFEDFYNLFIGTKALEKNEPNNISVAMLSILVDSNTILSKKALNSEKDKHCEKIEEYLINGWEYITKLTKY